MTNKTDRIKIIDEQILISTQRYWLSVDRVIDHIILMLELRFNGITSEMFKGITKELLFDRIRHFINTGKIEKLGSDKYQYSSLISLKPYAVTIDILDLKNKKKAAMDAANQITGIE